MAKLAGYTPVGDRARHYIDPSGREVSRRTYLNAQAAAAGYKGTYAEAQRQLHAMQRNPNYQRRLTTAARVTGESKRSLSRIDSDFNKKYRAAFFRPDRTPKKFVSNKPHGPLAQFLEYLGLRRSGAPYAVGDSPRR